MVVYFDDRFPLRMSSGGENGTRGERPNAKTVLSD